MKTLLQKVKLFVLLLSLLASLNASAQLSGAYTINASGSGGRNYTSFSAAITALAGGISGPVVFTVASGTYNAQVIIPATAGKITGTSYINTITFDGGVGNAANVILTNTGNSGVNDATLTFNNTCFVTVENMTITNTGASEGYGVLFYGPNSGASYMDNCKLLNCIVTAPQAITTGPFCGVAFNSMLSGNPIANNSSVCTNNTIDGCTIYYGAYGIADVGGASNGTAPNSAGDVFSNNTIYNSCIGIELLGNYAPKVLYNKIFNTNSSGLTINPYASSRGILIQACQASSTDYIDVSGNNLSGFSVADIYIQNSPAASFNAYPSEHTRITNNVIVASPYATSSFRGCLYMQFTDGAYVWNNSLNLTTFGVTNYGGAYVEALSGSACSNLDIENNIFEYSGTPSATGWPMISTATTSTISNNLLFNTNNSGGLTSVSTSYQSANLSGTTTATDYGTQTTGLGTSYYANPNFVSSTDLHITGLPAGYSCPRGAAKGLLLDIDKQARPTNPDIGADEIASVSPVSATSSFICSGGSIQLKASAQGSVTPTAGSYTWNPGSASGYTFTASPTSTTTYTLSGNDATGCSVTPATYVVNVGSGTVAPAVSISVNPSSPVCGNLVNGTFTFTAVPVNGGTQPIYNWQINGNTVFSTTNPVWAPDISGANAGGTLNSGDIVTCVMTSNSTCYPTNDLLSVTSNAITIEMNPGPTGPITENICSGASMNYLFASTTLVSQAVAQLISSTGLTYTGSNLYNVTGLSSTYSTTLTNTFTNATSAPLTAVWNFTLVGSGSCGIHGSNTLTLTVSPSTISSPTAPAGTTSLTQGSAPTVYTTTAATGATSYNWTVSGTGNTIFGTGTSATVQWGPTYSGMATVSVTAVNACTSSSAFNTTVTVTSNAPTAYNMTYNSGTNTGGSPVSTCPGGGFIGVAQGDASITYSLIQNGNTGSPVATFSSGTGAAFTFSSFTPTAGNVYTVIGKDVSNNTTSMNGSVTMNSPPTTPTTPSGVASKCQGGGTNVYTTSSTGALSYTWSVNGGSNSISSSGTSATVTWDALYNGTATVSVTATNTCGTTSPGGSLNVVVNPGSLSAPSTPSGTTTRCIGSGTDLYTASSAGATSYAWGITGGSNSISGTTSTGTATWDAAFSGTATISVTATNGCGTSSPTTLNVVVNTAPSTPSNPAGTNSRCVGSGSDTYTSSATGASSYNWSVTVAAGSISGTGTTANVTWSPTYTGTATVSVTATNTCGTSSMAVTSVAVVTTPPTPSTPSGTTSRCVGSNISNYTTSSAGATSYSWSITPAAGGITGTSTTATVTWVASYVGTATISVTASNICGTSSSSSTLVIVNGLNGTYVINNGISGAGNLYPNTNVFNNFTSAITAMTCGVGGPVLFNVVNGTYNEQVIIPASVGDIPGASLSNTITFDGGTGNAANVILTNAPSGANIATLTFNGCDYVTVKNMTINNTLNTGSGYGVLFYGTAGFFPVPFCVADNNKLLNCVINVPVSAAQASDIYGVAFGGGTSAISGSQANFTNNTVDGCKINNGTAGIYGGGPTGGSTYTVGNIISNNTVTNAFYIGIFLNGVIANKVLNNTVSTNSTYSGNRGIWVGGNSQPSATDYIEVSGNTVTSFNLLGIFLNGIGGSSTQHLKVTNNMVGGGITGNPTGCIVMGTTTSYVDIWNNTLLMNNSGTASTNAALDITATSGSGNFNIRNNILAYTGASTVNGQPLWITSGVPLAGSVIDDNLFYNLNNTSLEASIGGATGTPYSNSTIVGGGGYNTNSVVADPQFVSTNISSPDLHITFQCIRGIQIAGVITDIDGQGRANPPNMGADEIAPSVVGAAGTISGLNSICAVQNGVAYSVPSISFATGYNWTVPTGASIVSGSNTNLITVNYPVTASSGNVIVQGINGACSGATNTLAVAVNTTPTVTITPSSGNICLGDVLPQTASGASTSYNWSPSTGLNSNSGASINASPNISTTYTITGTTAQGCTSSTTDVVLVRSLPPLVVKPNNAVCTGGTTATLVASGASTYTWSPTTNLTPSAGTTATETAQISALTIYTVTGTGSNGCTTNTTVPVATVAVGGTISAPFSIICSGTTKPLSVIGAAGNDYQWQISTDNLAWTNINGATNTTYTTASGDGTTNKFYRMLANSNACWNVASTTAEVDVSIPTITVSASNITDNSLILNWGPTGTGNYTISYSGPTSATLTSVTPAKTITGLTANGTYSITVTQTGVGCAASGTITGVTTLCAMPTGVTLSSPASSQILVSWTGVGGADYRVYYRPLFSYNTFFTKDVSNVSSVLLTKQGNNNLYASTTYEVYVSRLDCPTTGATGQGTSPTNVTTLPNVSCATPSIDSVRSLCPVQIEVFIHPGSSPTNNYNIYIQRITPTILAVNSYGVTGNYFTINVPYSGDQFLIAAESKCSGGGLSALYVWPGNITIKPLCSSLSNLVLSNPTCHGFTASWNADPCLSNSSSGYELDLRVQGTLGYNSYGAPLPQAPVGPNKLVNWATAGRTYQVFVRSIYNCNGYVTYGPSSQVQTITTLSSGCRDEDTQQPEETKPAVQQYAQDNSEVFSLYPNPNNGEFVVDLSRYSSEEDAVRIEVINMIGQTVMTHLTTISGGHMSEFINLPNGTAAGTYMVRLTAGKNVYTAKINVSK